MPEYLYVLTMYYYATYSYSGIEVLNTVFFRTEEGAKQYAKEKNLKIVLSCNNPDKECTIEKELLRD